VHAGLPDWHEELCGDERWVREALRAQAGADLCRSIPAAKGSARWDRGDCHAV